MTKFHHGQNVWVHELTLQPAKFDRYSETSDKLMMINLNAGKHYMYGEYVNASRVSGSKHEAIDAMIQKLETIKADMNQ